VIPETIGALVAFLGLIAPGVAYELLREKRRPSIEETAFREASRTALTSLVFTTGSIALLAGVHAVSPDAVLDAAAWIEHGKKYVSANVGLVGRTLLIELGLALALATIADRLFRRSAPGQISPGSVWFQLFRQRRPAGATPWLHVRLDDETEIWGFVGDYSADQRLENRELTIRGPKLQYRRRGDTTNEALSSWSSILLRGDSIVWMKVAYVADDSPPGSPRLVPAVQPTLSAFSWRPTRRRRTSADHQEASERERPI
jgi:hypothetical protein